MTLPPSAQVSPDPRQRTLAEREAVLVEGPVRRVVLEVAGFVPNHHQRHPSLGQPHAEAPDEEVSGRLLATGVGEQRDVDADPGLHHLDHHRRAVDAGPIGGHDDRARLTEKPALTRRRLGQHVPEHRGHGVGPRGSCWSHVWLRAPPRWERPEVPSSHSPPRWRERDRGDPCGRLRGRQGCGLRSVHSFRRRAGRVSRSN